MKILDKKINKALKESIKHVLKEGTADEAMNDRWERMIKMMGCDEIVSELYNYFSSDQLEDFMHSLDDDYDLGLFDDEESEY